MQFPTKNQTSQSKLFLVGKKGYFDFSGLVSVRFLLPVLTACAGPEFVPQIFSIAISHRPRLSLEIIISL